MIQKLTWCHFMGRSHIGRLGRESMVHLRGHPDVKKHFLQLHGRPSTLDRLDRTLQPWTQGTVNHADVVCRSLISACKGIEFDRVQRAQSPSEAWKTLSPNYEAEGLRETAASTRAVSNGDRAGGGPHAIYSSLRQKCSRAKATGNRGSRGHGQRLYHQ